MNVDKSTLATGQQGHNHNNDPEEALLPELGFSPARLLPVEIAAQQHPGYLAGPPLQQQQQQQHPYYHAHGHGQDPLNALTTLAVAAAPPQDYNNNYNHNHNNSAGLHQHQLQLHDFSLTDPNAPSHHTAHTDYNNEVNNVLNALPQVHHQTQLMTHAGGDYSHHARHQDFSMLSEIAHNASVLQHPSHQDFTLHADVASLPPPLAPAAAATMPSASAATMPAASTKSDDPQVLHAELLAKDKEIKALKRALNKAQRKQNHSVDSTASMIGEAVLSLTKDNLNPDGSSAGDGTAANDPNKIKNLQERWKARFQQLVRFKLKHGHANVPKSYSDAPLHAWVRKQRINKQIRDKSAGVKGLTKEQVEALESIGFEWVVGHQPKDELWQSNYERLVQLYTIHGYIPTHCNDKSLTKWMQNQRARRKLLEAHGEGKARGMNWERVQKLEAVGFTWDARK